MHSKNEQNKSNQEDLSLAEQVFDRLKIYSEGFKPSFFSNSDLAHLRLSSKTLNSVVEFDELNRRLAQKLLNYVVRGEQDKAQALIARKPELLLIRIEAIDYSGRTIIGTAFQAAIGAGDKPMWEMMLPYFESLEPGEALRQFHQQFPHGIEDTPASELKAYYNAIALAIINDDDQGLKAIEGFRQEITSQKEITQGKHFNLQHLIAAYQAYIDNFDALADWYKRDKFWQKVIGYIQRQMTAYDAQIHCSGVKKVLDNESSFARQLEFSGGEKFFPLRDNSGLGLDFACFSYASGMRGGCRVSLGGDDEAAEGCRGNLEKLCKAKTDALAQLRESLEQGVHYKLN